MSQKELMDDLARVIARHSGWLDGRTWQQACQGAAEGYFEADDLAPLVNLEALTAELQRQLDL